MLERILNDAGIGSDAGYYEGRGATLSDLDAVKLKAVHDGILENSVKRLRKVLCRW